MRSTSIRASPEHAKELRLLKESWKKNSIDDVLEELIRPRRIEKVGVLEIEHANNNRPTFQNIR